MTNRTFYHTLYKKTAVLKITSQMFDLNFHEAVIGYVALNNTMKQKPSSLIPSKNVGGRTKINNLFTKNIEQFHTFSNSLSFNYYMKTYFKYFKMKMPKASNK